MNKIQITPSMISSLSGVDNTASNLFDGNTDTWWFKGWQPSAYPASVVIDLGSVKQISKIRVFDGSGQPIVKISKSLDNENFTPVINITLDLYKQWSGDFMVLFEARYIKVEIQDPQGDQPMAELEFYTADKPDTPTTPTGPTEPSQPTTTPIKTKLTGEARKIGINRFPWVPDMPFAFQREYNMWEWHWTGPTSYKTEFGIGPDPTFTFPKHYSQYTDKVIVPCGSWLPSWWENYTSRDHPISDPGTDGTKPEHYSRMTKFLTWFTNKYKTQLKYMEMSENEPLRWWTQAYTMQQFCALQSAAYDAIKKEAPYIKVVLPGLSEINLAQLLEMNQYCKVNRNGVFFADVINVHHYSNAANKLPGQDPRIAFSIGISPEEDRLKERLESLVTMCRSTFPGKEVWLSEFGYDTNPPSLQRAPAYSNYSAEEVQAMWLVRSYLEGIAAGVDVMFMYNGCDEPGAHNGGLYQSSGLIYSEHPQDGKPSFGHKVSFNKLVELTRWLNGYTFSKYQQIGDARIMTFKKGTIQRHVYWLGSSKGHSASIDIEGKLLTATEVPQMYEKNGKKPLVSKAPKVKNSISKQGSDTQEV